MLFGPAPCHGFISGVNCNEANEKSAARKHDEIYLTILKNINVEGRNKKSGSFCLERKFLDVIDAEKIS